MGAGNLINRYLNRLGLHLHRVPKREIARGALSSSMTETTEISCSPTGGQENDLWRFFTENTSGDIHKWHHFFEIYDRHFAPRRNQPGLRMLEIGVFRGGSLRMWRNYFRSDAIIVGLDIDAGCRQYEKTDDNVFVRIGDQTDPAFLREVIKEFGPFDIILDDGGHTTNQQIVSFNELYLNGLSEDGVYLVEDLHSNYWPKYKDSDISFVDLAKELVDRLHEPYFGRHSELLFRQGDEQQQRSMEVSKFCANTRSILFYDSIIVFERRPKTAPVSEIR